MGVTESLNRINRMRNGEKIKCPKCEDGHMAAVGDPKNTYVFRCDKCGTSIVMRTSD